MVSVQRILRPLEVYFDIRRNGIPIKDHPLKPKSSVNPNISYSQLYTEWDACVAANLDPFLWFKTSKYPQYFKAQTIAWYEGHKLIKTHTTDASIKKGR